MVHMAHKNGAHIMDNVNGLARYASHKKVILTIRTQWDLMLRKFKQTYKPVGASSCTCLQFSPDFISQVSKFQTVTKSHHILHNSPCSFLVGDNWPPWLPIVFTIMKPSATMREEGATHAVNRLTRLDERGCARQWRKEARVKQEVRRSENRRLM